MTLNGYRAILQTFRTPPPPLKDIATFSELAKFEGNWLGMVNIWKKLIRITNYELRTWKIQSYIFHVTARFNFYETKFVTEKYSQNTSAVDKKLLVSDASVFKLSNISCILFSMLIFLQYLTMNTEP